MKSSIRLRFPGIPVGDGGILIAEGIITILFLFAYLCVLSAVYQGRTPGKAALGIRIAPLRAGR